jgi:rod shape-determining protein MreC
MILDQKAHFFKPIHTRLSVIVLPIQYLINTPINFVHRITDNVTRHQELLDDNARLRAHQFLLQAKLQKLLTLEKENQQLRTLLQSAPHVDGRFIVGQLLAVSLDPLLQQIVVDKGMRDKVYIGQPVLDAYGVMGQVIHVGLFTSKVLLIVDPKSAIPVEDNRNGTRAIAIGMGSSGKLTLINLPATSDVQKGDLFVSSGLGLRYPVGYPVAVVSEVQQDRRKNSVAIVLDPSAHINQSRQIILVWPNQASLTQAAREELKAKTPDEDIEPTPSARKPKTAGL